MRPAKSLGSRKQVSSKGRAVKIQHEEELDVHHILDRLVFHSEYLLVEKLTKTQILVLLKAANQREGEFRARTEELEAENQELATLNERLMKERDAAKEEAKKRHIRDVFYRDEAQKAEIKKAAEALAKDMVAAEVVKMSAKTDETRSVTSSSQPTTSPPQAMSTPKHEPAPARTASLLRRVLTGFASPFASRSTTLAPPSSPTPQPSPLGDLPSSRKRSAPEPELSEPIHEHVPSTPTPKPRAVPSSVKVPATMPASLSTITENTEPPETSTSLSHATPCRPRPIHKVRAARQNLLDSSKKSWPSKPVPRERNADARFGKLQQLAAEPPTPKPVQAEKTEVAPRPTKRVKVDQLLYIPHNRPGDAEGTFRAPDIDSDDEMEVDIDVPLRPNMFDASHVQESQEKATEQANELSKQRLEKAKQTPSAQPAVSSTPTTKLTPPAPSASPKQAPEQSKYAAVLEEARLRQEAHQIQQWLKECEPHHIEQLEQELKQIREAQKPAVSQQPSAVKDQSGSTDELYLPVYDFPSVGNYQPAEEIDPEEEEFLALEFEYGMRHWERTGELLPIY